MFLRWIFRYEINNRQNKLINGVKIMSQKQLSTDCVFNKANRVERYDKRETSIEKSVGNKKLMKSKITIDKIMRRC